MLNHHHQDRGSQFSIQAHHFFFFPFNPWKTHILGYSLVLKDVRFFLNTPFYIVHYMLIFSITYINFFTYIYHSFLDSIKYVINKKN